MQIDTEASTFLRCLIFQAKKQNCKLTKVQDRSQIVAQLSSHFQTIKESKISITVQIVLMLHIKI